MAMYIEDGKGTGYKAQVTKENQLVTWSIVAPLQHHVNHTHGDMYSLLINKTPTGAGDCFCYIKNTDDIDIVITSMKFSAATDETITVKFNDTGTASGGTATTPVNRNATSGHTAAGTFETGVDITGLSGGSSVDQFVIDGATGTLKVIWESGLILPKNQTLTLYATTGAIALVGSISFFYHDDDL